MPKNPQPKDATEAFERAQRVSRGNVYHLRLYVTGATPQSRRATNKIKAICEQHLKGRYDLKVIDLYQQPDLAAEDQIVAVPTLIKDLPLPTRRLVGDLSVTERVLAGLNITGV
ncbi:hypothetical protein DRN85_09490 [Methanosarcinales archaeon]|nr:MAG: hypothetical protein DRN85_09490 [Methanosarcinales archaeon]